jgi:hypothetical protein
MADTSKWSVKGDWFDTCKCSIPGPCTFAQAPTSGDCEGILAWHIRNGNVQLDGLNVIINFHLDDDLASWRAEIPGKVVSSAEALGGPTTLPGQRVQVHNPGGAETGPGAIATYGKSTADKADAFGLGGTGLAVRANTFASTGRALIRRKSVGPANFSLDYASPSCTKGGTHGVAAPCADD